MRFGIFLLLSRGKFIVDDRIIPGLAEFCPDEGWKLESVATGDVAYGHVEILAHGCVCLGSSI